MVLTNHGWRSITEALINEGYVPLGSHGQGCGSGSRCLVEIGSGFGFWGLDPDPVVWRKLDPDPGVWWKLDRYSVFGDASSVFLVGPESRFS